MTEERDFSSDREWLSGVRIWAFGGKMGCGKNYLAEQVLLPLLSAEGSVVEGSGGCLVMAFADHLKIQCLARYPELRFEELFGEKTAESRKRLQDEGASLRKSVGKDVWIRTLENWIRMYVGKGITRFIITDIRHQNELEWANHLGAVTVYVSAPGRNRTRLMAEAKGDSNLALKLGSHESEKELESMISDFKIVVMNDYGQEKDSFEAIRRLI